MRKELVIVYFLEMTNPAQLRPKRSQRTDVEVRQVEHPLPEFNRFLYAAVGAQWYWIDRLKWTYQQWSDWLARPSVSTWVMYVGGTPAGYFELESHPDDCVDICYFGLLTPFTGQGLGGHLLTLAVERAWAVTTRRVKLNTCSLDHPSALSNYQARGFRIYREITERRSLPDQPLGPWPGHWPPE